MGDATLQIILAIIGSGLLTSLGSGGITLIARHLDRKNGNAKRLEAIEKKLDEHIAQSYRNKILDMQNSCLRNERHSFEEFQECLSAISNYEKFCKENDVDNEKCKMAIEYIRGIYRSCLSQSDFAPMSASMIDEAELRRIINQNNIGNN